MRLRIDAPDELRGVIELPASKSMSNRLLMLGALCKEAPQLRRLATCDDTRAMISGLSTTEGTIDVGAAGTAMRFLTAFHAASEGSHVILDGTARMRQRPISILVEALRSMGADIRYCGEDGFPPIEVRGKRLTGGDIAIDGSVSSQYISALMMIAPRCGGCIIKLKGEVTSEPYIDMTLSLMREFGIRVEWDKLSNRITIERGEYVAPSRLINVESDWSAASYWYALGQLIPSHRLVLSGLCSCSTQGDRRITDLIAESMKPQPFCRSFASTPDIAQTMVVMLCLLDKPFKITGLHTLRIKETDRIEALRRELAKAGYLVVTGDDFIGWDGKSRTAPMENVAFDTYDDHRMAMAMSLVATRLPGVIINDAQVVTKSYPNYWQHLAEAGFKITEL